MLRYIELLRWLCRCYMWCFLSDNCYYQWLLVTYIFSHSFHFSFIGSKMERNSSVHLLRSTSLPIPPGKQPTSHHRWRKSWRMERKNNLYQWRFKMAALFTSQQILVSGENATSYLYLFFFMKMKNLHIFSKFVLYPWLLMCGPFPISQPILWAKPQSQ